MVLFSFTTWSIIAKGCNSVSESVFLDLGDLEYFFSTRVLTSLFVLFPHPISSLHLPGVDAFKVIAWDLVHYTQVLRWCPWEVPYQHPLECQVRFDRCHPADPAQGLLNPPDVRQSDSVLGVLLFAVLLVDLMAIFLFLMFHLFPHSLKDQLD